MNTFFKKNNTVLLIAMIAVLVVPGVVFAQQGTTIVRLVELVETIMKALFPIITAMGILAFGYNIIKYLTSKNLQDQNIYKAGILNSLYALFIFFVFIGLITVLARSLGIPSLGADITTIDPAGVSAGQAEGISTLRNYALALAKFLSQRIIPLMIGAAILFFMGNIVISMTKSDNEAERTKLNGYLRWGILAIFLLLTLFSVVGLFTGSLFGTGPVIPQFPTSARSRTPKNPYFIGVFRCYRGLSWGY